MIRAKRIIITVLICTSTILGGCAIPGVTEPLDNEKIVTNSKNENNENNESGEAVDPFDYEKIYIPEGKTIYNIGDKVSPLMYINDANGDKNALEFTINSANVYEHASDSGIDKSKFSDGEVYRMLSPCQPSLVLVDRAYDARCLVCDITLKYDDIYVDAYNGGSNITYFALVYVYDDNSYILTGMPIYLSNSNGWHYTNFDISTEPINLQVGWIIDKEIFEMDDFDISRLYICTLHNSSNKYKEFVNLGLK